MSDGKHYCKTIHTATAINILQKSGPEKSRFPQQEFMGGINDIVSQIGIKHNCRQLLCGERRLKNAAAILLRPGSYLFIVGDEALKDLERFRNAILNAAQLPKKG